MHHDSSHVDTPRLKLGRRGKIIKRNKGKGIMGMRDIGITDDDNNRKIYWFK